MQIPVYLWTVFSSGMTIISFSALGLPYDGTEIILKDRESGEKNRIWISVQTGRIRWEEVH